MCSVVNDRGEVRTGMGHEGSEWKQRYSCILSSTLALDGVGLLTPCPGLFMSEKRPDKHCVGGWVCPKASLDGCSNILHPPGL
jgi:hypothetical protein